MSPYLQYAPRVVLVVRDAAVALSPVHEAGVNARIVHRRVARMELATGDELIDVGGIASIRLLGLLLAPSPHDEPYTTDDDCESNDADDDACRDTCRVGFARLLLLWRL
jgi:hypothetical protein